MDPTRWQRIQTLFHEAASLPGADQPAFLRAACSGDDALRSEVLAMLEADATSGSILDRDLGHVAHQVLSQTTSTLN